MSDSTSAYVPRVKWTLQWGDTPTNGLPCRRLAVTSNEAIAAVCDAKERGQDVIYAERCERCGAMHLHRKQPAHIAPSATPETGR